MGVLDHLLDARMQEAFTSGGSSSVNPANDARKRQSPAERKRAQRSSGGGGSGRYDESEHPRGEKGTASGGKFVRKGSSGDDVKAVQEKVGAKQDGEYGEMTRKAVMDFQRKHGLVVDGIVGHQTTVALSGNVKSAKTAKAGALKDSDRAKLKRLAKSKPARSSKRRGRAPERGRGGEVV